MKFGSGIRAVLALVAATFLLAACDSSEERAQEHYKRALELVEQGDIAKAKLEFRNAMKFDNKLVDARFRFAEILKDEENLRGAVRQYLGVVELDSKHVPARTALAEIFLIANQIDEAEKHIDVAFDIDPDAPKVRAIKASVEYKRGNVENAVKLAEEALEKNPADSTARLVLVAQANDGGDRDEAMRQVEIGLKETPRDLSLNIVKLAILEGAGDLDGLGEQLRRMVEYFPETDSFRVALARWYVTRNDLDAAEAQIRAIAANNPGDFEKSLDVVRFLSSFRGSEAARAELEKLAARQDDAKRVDYELALAALDRSEGDEEAAIARLEGIIAREGKSAAGDKARVERTRIHLARREKDEADRLIAEVLENDPTNVEALTLRAARRLRDDRIDDAIEDLRSALDGAPEDTRILQMLAQAYERNGNPELAQERMAEAVKVSRFDPEITLRYARSLVRANKLDVAENLLVDAMRKRGETREQLILLAQIRLRQEDWDQARAAGERLQELNPDDPVAERILASVLLGQRRFDESAQLLKQLAEGSEKRSDTDLVSFIRALIAGGEVDRAVSYLDDLIEKDPENATAHMLLGSVYAARGDVPNAEASFLRAAEIDPGRAAAYTNLVRLYASVGEQDKAREILDRGLAVNEDDRELRLTRAMQYETEGDYDKAIEAYQALYAENPDMVVVANNLASLLADHRADDPAAIERAFNIAKRFRASEQPYLQDTFGWLLHLRGESKRAIDWLAPAAKKLSSNPVVQYHAGVVYAANGEVFKAREHLQRALELGETVRFSKAEEARAALKRLEEDERSTATQ